MEELFLTKINIKQVRHLQNIEIALSETERKHLILTGKNGSGKTSVLEFMQKFIQYILKLKKDYKKLYYDAHRITAIDSNNLDFEFNHKINTSKSFLKFFEQFTSLFDANNFIIAYFSAKRGIDVEQPSGIKKVDISHPTEINDSLSSSFLQYIVNLKAEKSFANDDGDVEKVKEIDTWFNSFENTLRQIFDDESLELVFDRKNFIFQFKTKDYELFDLNTLSDGYSAVLKILAEYA